MPIQEQNIVFVESQVMDDVPEGGGAATGRVIEDGHMNNVFEDISDLDRAYGRFNLRKIFLAVRTLSTDLYGGAKTVITALPQDAALGYTLFANADPFDTREDAADKVESYLYKSVTWPGYLLENHITGMRAISVLQRVGSQLPPIGKTLCIVQDEGLAGEREQYVRVTKVEVATRTFSDDLYANDREFERWVVTLSLSDALRTDFAGHTPRYHDTSYTYAGKARIRDTTVADAARYYGAQRLVAPAAIGDLAVRASSVFTPLVPSAQTETPLSNRALNPSLTVTLSAGAREVEIAQQAHTLARSVSAESRRLTWVETLRPIPAPGALSISYRAQGSWYELTDNGAGAVTGTDPTIGAGTVDYATGALTLTLGALPDVGSHVMLTWGSPLHYAVRAGATADASPTVDLRYTLEHSPVVPDSLAIAYTTAGAAQTATASSGGAISGPGVTGTLNATTGEVLLRFAVLPDRGAPITSSYTWRDGDALVQTLLSAPVEGGAVQLEALAPFRPGGTCKIALANGGVGDGYFTADGLLWLVEGAFQPAPTSYVTWYNQQIGTYNGATGVVTITHPVTASARQWSPGFGWVLEPVALAVVALGTLKLERDTAAFDPQAVAGELAPTLGVVLDLAATSADPIIAGSVQFTLAGKTYEDRSGTLYTDIDPATGAGLVAGTINYETHRATISLWESGPVDVSVTSCLTVYGQWAATEAAFRTLQAPVKPEALTITATATTGEPISAAADADGNISGDYVRGEINYEVGSAWVEFGAMADDPEYTGGGTPPQVWQPLPVQPGTIRYNAVAYSYLPLDAGILGIDPVRLPSDGRVPIYRAGDVVMVMHTAETAPATIGNGDTIDCGRGRIAWIRVIDATGKTIRDGFTLDRATGLVTFTDISGMAMPVMVRHTVGDLRQITDAQITGQLTLARPLTHNYPAGESIVASCLIHGDRRARVSAVWDQATWNGTWSDSLVGSEATATLDVIAHPIEVTNEGAETERWLLRWVNTTNVELIGQRRGLVYSGPFTADIAPINPRTRNPDGTGGVPYLRIPLAANGGGWSAGNVVRINTVGALADIWIARSIQQSDEPLGDGEDGVELYALGNIDRP
ncbi:hypothetical protein [Thauera propionica]|uniref:hypothetical protein n=1 Tax=Thauera propionica TaxID=2019431 RepID=UPI0023F27564|nr:hypothetical protein [Thauera propionica]MDD3674981.1 hypothetical protein [Thauera propionica]